MHAPNVHAYMHACACRYDNGRVEVRNSRTGELLYKDTVVVNGKTGRGSKHSPQKNAHFSKEKSMETGISENQMSKGMIGLGNDDRGGEDKGGDKNGGITALMVGDYRMEGREGLIACTTEVGEGGGRGFS